MMEDSLEEKAALRKRPNRIPGRDGPRAASGVRAGIAARCSALARAVKVLGPGWAHQCGTDIAVVQRNITKINAIICPSDVKWHFN